MNSWRLPGGASGKESTGQCKRCQTFRPWVGTIPWRRKWQPTPVFLPGESRGQRSLAGYSPWGRKKSDRTERLSTVALWRGWTVFGGLRCGPEKQEGLCKKRIQSKWPCLRESVFSFIYIYMCVFVCLFYLAMLGRVCLTWNRQSSLWCGGSLIAACELLVVVCAV